VEIVEISVVPIETCWISTICISTEKAEFTWPSQTDVLANVLRRKTRNPRILEVVEE
tara:strand:- start:313 stop:483 length:171 start_codon:yes stop_codon:yes gene_type:complete